MPMDPMAMSRAFELKMLEFRPYGSHDMSGVATIDFHNSKFMSNNV